MYNLLGSEVKSYSKQKFTKRIPFFELNLEDIEEGVYFISILLDGKVMETTKIVVQ